MTRYALALGSNLGDRLSHLRAGVHALAEQANLSSVSSLYETEPVGGPEQGPYLNAVVLIETSLDGHRVLELANQIEAALGRERGTHWGPRTLDVDLVATSGDPIDDPPRLVVPHPRSVDRRFVLEPLSEIWPAAPVGGGVTASEALRDSPPDGVDLLSREWTTDRPRTGVLWVAGQMLIFLAIGAAYVLQDSLARTAPGLVGVVGVLMAVVGLAGMLWSARSLGRGLTAVPEPVAGATLIVSGPYRWVRHPMYAAVFLLFAGFALYLGSPIAVALSVALLAYFWLKSGYEEKQLRIVYPDYRSYRQRVRSRFFPFLI